MGKTAIIDELHLTVRIPADLPEADAEVVRRALTGRAFMDGLRRAVRTVIRRTPGLTPVRVRLTR
ncbi:MAG: hypothetical protein JWO38_8336 [Gemmataceae bacterium]|nr:hypothetical protein [Gemmataceae bacterium]